MSHVFREGAEELILSTRRPPGRRWWASWTPYLLGALVLFATLWAWGFVLSSESFGEGTKLWATFLITVLPVVFGLKVSAVAEPRATARRSEAAAKEVALYTARLWWRDARGERSVDLSEVARFWRDESILPGPRRERVSVVTLRSGEKLEFTSWLPDYDALCVRLSCALAPRFFPEHFACLERGERVALGKLSLDRESLHWPDERLPWADLLGYEFRAHPQTLEGVLVLRFGNGEGAPREYYLDSRDNPELGLLLALVDQCAPRRVRVDLSHAQEAEAEPAAATREAARAKARG